jgi:hypothetical protein
MALRVKKNLNFRVWHVFTSVFGEISLPCLATLQLPQCDYGLL